MKPVGVLKIGGLMKIELGCAVSPEGAHVPVLLVSDDIGNEVRLVAEVGFASNEDARSFSAAVLDSIRNGQMYFGGSNGNE